MLDEKEPNFFNSELNGNETCSSLSQYAKALSPISATLFGKEIELTVDWKNELFSITVISEFEGNSMLSNKLPSNEFRNQRQRAELHSYLGHVNQAKCQQFDLHH